MENQTSRPIDHTSDEIVQRVYNNDNNYIVKGKERKGKERKTCIIFFSGNGLYYPNEEEEFTEKVIRQNIYEWQNISDDKLFLKKTDKIIFVRDVHKQ